MPVWTEGHELAMKTMVAANEYSAVRAGFDHKYPTAYENLRAKDLHHEAATGYTKAAKTYRKQRTTLEKKMDSYPSRS
ncbi:hypothetical protein BO71DRAFT_482711 [Aspergillus ellipticus CBS 707.79]|uniref:Uncharacterized protein n=1 Tax=Aspergillus ellipticus CBS 707.79 TaxID=1448320 RepID=A0A319DE36_9EURO|nr:hypothetical protein BO71DRAFT_482711 [Aspergillus ellipticus CBS 707.79]